MASKTVAPSEPKKRGRPAGTPVVPALVDTLDFNDTLTVDELKTATNGSRNSPWNQKLNELKAAVISGAVPNDDSGNPKFVKLATFGNSGTAQTHIRKYENTPELLPQGGQWGFATKKVVVIPQNEDGTPGKAVNKCEVWARFVPHTD